jgi:hypothetical protein
VLPVVVFLPPPAALTPLLNNHLPEIQSHNRVNNTNVSEDLRCREYSELPR